MPGIPAPCGAGGGSNRSRQIAERRISHQNDAEKCLRATSPAGVAGPPCLFICGNLPIGNWEFGGSEGPQMLGSPEGSGLFICGNLPIGQSVFLLQSRAKRQTGSADATKRKGVRLLILFLKYMLARGRPVWPPATPNPPDLAGQKNAARCCCAAARLTGVAFRRPWTPSQQP